MKLVSELKDAFVPLVLGCASLMAWVSLRSDSLSKRIRDAGQELMKPKLDSWRRDSLLKQIDRFKPRYSANNKALLWLLFAVTAFFLMILLSAFGSTDLATFRSAIESLKSALPVLALFAMLVGIVLLLVAAVYVWHEIRRSEQTLFEDCDTIIKHLRTHADIPSSEDKV